MTIMWVAVLAILPCFLLFSPAFLLAQSLSSSAASAGPSLVQLQRVDHVDESAREGALIQDPNGTRKEQMGFLVTVPLLIIDDLGMRKLPLTAAEELLEIIMRRCERASTMLTSNSSAVRGAGEPN